MEPVSNTLLSIIDNEAQKESQRKKASGYWMNCPSCGRIVVKKQLLKTGCYICGWKEGDEVKSYKINCPDCGREVVTKELNEKGCYLCGWKPTLNSVNPKDALATNLPDCPPAVGQVRRGTPRSAK